jgi:uncharacterized membrane protein
MSSRSYCVKASPVSRKEMVRLMKRAAIICMAAATLLVLGLSSSLVYAGSSKYDSQSGASVGGTSAQAASSADRPGDNGGNCGGGGADQGDADGLSGIKNRPIGQGSAATRLDRFMLIVETWRKFMMMWIR